MRILAKVKVFFLMYFSPFVYKAAESRFLCRLSISHGKNPPGASSNEQMKLSSALSKVGKFTKISKTARDI